MFYGGSMTEKNNKKTIFGWSMYDWARSPYPGGVGPVTVSALYSNLAKLIS